MGTALKQQEAEFDEVFGNIAKLYDHAENIIKIAYDETIPDRDKFISEIEVLVAQIEDSANILAEDLSKVIESGTEPTNAINVRVNMAIRKILVTVDEYQKHIKLQGN